MATPTKTKPAPVLENFYSVSQAAVRLGLREEDDESKKGEKWLRDGVNLHGWPCHRLAGQLKFSDSNLAVIAEKHSNATHHRSKPRRTRKRAAAPVK